MRRTLAPAALPPRLHPPHPQIPLPTGLPYQGTSLPETHVQPENLHSARQPVPPTPGRGLELQARKGRGKLTLQCPPERLPQLRAQHRSQAGERPVAGHAWQDHDLVFATLEGRPIERSDDWREWKTVLREAGVRDAWLHDARHTAATLLMEQGVHIRVVQEVLGHARVTTTERYTHVTSPQVHDASRRMGQALWGQERTRKN